VPQDDCLDRELTVRENLFIYGRYFGLKRPVIRERLAGLLEFAQLQDKAEDQVETLSGGMRRRLTIARALINEPEILLLDEPTTGLDPQARHVLWDRLFRLKQNGVTLILTTHYMDEAEQLCDRLVVLDRGKIVAHGSPRDLIDAHVTREVLELRFPVGEQESSARTIRNGTFRSGASIGARVEALPDRVVVYADDGEAALAAIHATSLSPLTALVRRASLEDVFLELTGRSLIE
jgi:lipooligosaccharide transport system ATP-binding protein